MTLDEYLSSKKESDTAFALRVKISQSQISRLRRGISMPSWSAIATIEKATDFKVTAADWHRQRLAAVG